MNDIISAVSTLGFPIVACIGLAWFCKYMIDNNNKHINKMMDMYENSNRENREAINACTKAIDKLCDKLDQEV